MDRIFINEQLGPTYNPAPELAMCDEDIREACADIGCYMAGLPTMMQLVRELRLLRAALTDDEESEV
jgi:hypothetical protein